MRHGNRNIAAEASNLFRFINSMLTKMIAA